MTRNHPFFVDGKGFVPAGGLAVGNAIVTRAGPSLTVKSIQWERSAAGYTVYNLLVQDDHTYFVGNGEAWVHNGDGDCAVARPEPETGLPDRIIKELPKGERRTPKENSQARNFFQRNRQQARKWWSDRTGQDWPVNTTHDEHPRSIKNGGDPLYIEPGFEGPAKPHMNGDFKEWGALGGRPRKIRL